MSILGTMVVAWSLGCNSADNSTEDMRYKAQSAIEATETFITAQQETFEANAKVSLKELRVELVDMEKQAEKMSDDVKENFKHNKKALEESLDEIEREMFAIHENSPDVWQSYKDATSNALQEARDQVEKLKEKLNV